MTETKTTSGPDLTSYDVILVNSSGGKDSQASLDLVTELAEAAGVADRIVVVHADLGRVEWAGTRALAAEQAAHYGHRFEVVSRDQDLLDQVEARGLWPSSKARYCTSDHKRDQVAKLLTKLAREVRDATGKSQPRILNVMGIRAEESTARARRQAFRNDTRATRGTRHVDEWLPIFEWLEGDVWARIEASGVRFHDAYRAGMSRLSCVFCIFASRDDLLIAGEHNPELLDTYVALEARIDHTFKADSRIADIKAALEAGVRGRPCHACPGCGCPDDEDEAPATTELTVGGQALLDFAA
jgi:3'-phosphoadenosine 5'-phosphosulfate sulfotransferase (PAPS reductase)/FAD synthetase